MKKILCDIENNTIIEEENNLSAEEQQKIEKESLILTTNETISNLKEWFDTYYTQHEQKYRRLHELNKLCDDKTDPMTKLLELYNEAEIKRKQIQSLEKVVKDNAV